MEIAGAKPDLPLIRNLRAEAWLCSGADGASLSEGLFPINFHACDLCSIKKYISTLT